MGTDVLLRPAASADVADIQRVADASWHAVYDDILGSDAVDEMLEEWYGDDAIESGVTHEVQDFFVAVRDETVVGYAHAGPHPPKRVYRLYRLYVHPDDWRSGIGRQLLAEVEQALYEEDVTMYEATVLADNDVATAFYESVGFEVVEQGETELAGVTADELIYRKRI
jgi:ribosomal protein S18 acetylase RimI-like enzyme